MGNSISSLLYKLWLQIKELFSLHIDTDEAGTIESIKKNIEFKGGNLWALVFACLIASIGLNTNSTAVIIGAMLISPLMGPIVGVGYAVGTNHFEVLKNSFRNLALMIVLSILAATIYFVLSPLKDATPELIGRIRPTIYDVLIAIFGGAIGIVASSRKDRGNAIPGVAIATALMPPLCTAGYGIATLNLQFFLGSFYLFFINSVFIALTTVITVRSLKFPMREFLDAKREKRVRLFITIIVVLTIIPSVITAWAVVNEAVFQQRANLYVNENFKFEESTVIKPYSLTYNRDTSVIELTIIGKPLEEDLIELLRERLKTYRLTNTRLVIHQSGDIEKRLNELNSKRQLDMSFVEKLYQDKDKMIKTKDDRIRILEEQLNLLQEKPINMNKPIDKISQKLAVVFPEILEFGYSKVVKASANKEQLDTIPTVIIRWHNGKMLEKERQRVEKFLLLEMGLDTLVLINY